MIFPLFLLKEVVMRIKNERPLLQGREARGTNPFHAAREQLVPKPRLVCL